MNRTESYAVLMLGGIPEKLFSGMDEAREYLESHDRLDYEKASIVWPIPACEIAQEGDS